MSLFRTFAPFFVVFLLGACGFRSLYGTDATGDAPGELATIKVNPIADRLGQQLRNNLLDLLNPRGGPANPRYFLTVSLDQSTQRLAIEKDAFATRANLRLRAEFSLQDPDSREIVLSGKSLVVSSYNILDSEFATGLESLLHTTQVATERISGGVVLVGEYPSTDLFRVSTNLRHDRRCQRDEPYGHCGNDGIIECRQ